MKFKIIVDSSSGLTCSQTEEYGWTLLPLQAEIIKIKYFLKNEHK